jgi:hypothetical protein
MSPNWTHYITKNNNQKVSQQHNLFLIFARNCLGVKRSEQITTSYKNTRWIWIWGRSKLSLRIDRWFLQCSCLKPLNYIIPRKPLIALEPELRKFQNWAEMKVKYATNNKNTQTIFPTTFVTWKNSYKLAFSRNYDFSFTIFHSQKTAGSRKFF